MSELTIFLPAENDDPFLIYDPLTGDTSESFFQSEEDVRFSDRKANVIIPMNRLSTATVSLPGTLKQKRKALPYSLEKYIVGALADVQFFVSCFGTPEILAYWTNKEWLVSSLEKLKASKVLLSSAVAQSKANFIKEEDDSYLCVKSGSSSFLVRKDGFFLRIDQSGYVISRLQEENDKICLISCDLESHNFLKDYPHTHIDLPWWRANFSRDDNWLRCSSLRRFLSQKGEYEWLVVSGRRFLVSMGLIFLSSLLLMSCGLFDFYKYKKGIDVLTATFCSTANPLCISEKHLMLKHRQGMIGSNDFLPMIAMMQRSYSVDSFPPVNRIVYERGILKLYYNGNELTASAMRIMRVLLRQVGYTSDFFKENGSFVVVVRYG
ncbi:hypothetical protein [Candidatus Ichthyocystis hellenicum]|uniref:hypothetical protein n=1 Tax=Candidatus Ichthyocystis hellenicum TaxID=1561003 RepID=UPI000B89BC01|nr:hypothetical protein [Candidatus Ichthyocystis hellenicum]